jgi:hypothetical protein
MIAPEADTSTTTSTVSIPLVRSTICPLTRAKFSYTSTAASGITVDGLNPEEMISMLSPTSRPTLTASTIHSDHSVSPGHTFQVLHAPPPPVPPTEHALAAIVQTACILLCVTFSCYFISCAVAKLREAPPTPAPVSGTQQSPGSATATQPPANSTPTQPSSVNNTSSSVSVPVNAPAAPATANVPQQNASNTAAKEGSTNSNHTQPSSVNNTSGSVSVPGIAPATPATTNVPQQDASNTAANGGSTNSNHAQPSNANPAQPSSMSNVQSPNVEPNQPSVTNQTQSSNISQAHSSVSVPIDAPPVPATIDGSPQNTATSPWDADPTPSAREFREVRGKITKLFETTNATTEKVDSLEDATESINELLNALIARIEHLERSSAVQAELSNNAVLSRSPLVVLPVPSNDSEDTPVDEPENDEVSKIQTSEADASELGVPPSDPEPLTIDHQGPADDEPEFEESSHEVEVAVEPSQSYEFGGGVAQVPEEALSTPTHGDGGSTDDDSLFGIGSLPELPDQHEEDTQAPPVVFNENTKIDGQDEKIDRSGDVATSSRPSNGTFEVHMDWTTQSSHTPIFSSVPSLPRPPSILETTPMVGIERTVTSRVREHPPRLRRGASSQRRSLGRRSEHKGAPGGFVAPGNGLPVTSSLSVNSSAQPAHHVNPAPSHRDTFVHGVRHIIKPKLKQGGRRINVQGRPLQGAGFPAPQTSQRSEPASSIQQQSNLPILTMGESCNGTAGRALAGHATAHETQIQSPGTTTTAAETLNEVEEPAAFRSSGGDKQKKKHFGEPIGVQMTRPGCYLRWCRVERYHSHTDDEELKVGTSGCWDCTMCEHVHDHECAPPGEPTAWRWTCFEENCHIKPKHEHWDPYCDDEEDNPDRGDDDDGNDGNDEGDTRKIAKGKGVARSLGKVWDHSQMEEAGGEAGIQGPPSGGTEQECFPQAENQRIGETYQDQGQEQFQRVMPIWARGGGEDYMQEDRENDGKYDDDEEGFPPVECDNFEYLGRAHDDPSSQNMGTDELVSEEEAAAFLQEGRERHGWI